jgi:hypothetical protein
MFPLTKTSNPNPHIHVRLSVPEADWAMGNGQHAGEGWHLLLSSVLLVLLLARWGRNHAAVDLQVNHQPGP